MSTAKALGSIHKSLAPPLNLRRHDRDHRAHVVQFYADDDFLVDSVARFVGTALGGCDSAIVIATGTHREGLERRLRSRGFDTAAAIRQGRLTSLDAGETLSSLSVIGWPDTKRFADVVGGLVTRARNAAGGDSARVAVFGEMVALLWEEGKPEAAIHLEQLWNELAKTHPFSLQCGYRINDFYREMDGQAFLKICEEHSSVFPVESYTELLTEEERLRNVAQLQQRAQALENEIAERKRVEQELRTAHDELEQRVVERTCELQQKNRQIQAQAETLESANRSLRDLSAHLLRVQDDERRRIARDLHDSTGQTLALLSMNLSGLQTKALKFSPDLAKAVSENSEIVNQVVGELRTMSYLLHPPLLDEVGLRSALHWYAEGFAQRSGIQVHLELAGDLGRLSRGLETAIFRVIQECLTNIHRHSGSPTATIRLYQDDGNITLEVEDAGKGMPLEKLSNGASSGLSGLGLRGMRERIEDFRGRLEIVSYEKGTHIKVAIPVSPESRTANAADTI
jgi:signal transduction histidine kinase